LTDNNESIYLEVLIIMGNGNFTTIQERASAAEYQRNTSGGSWTYLRHDASKLQLPPNAVAYRFYVSPSYLSGGIRNWPRRRPRGVARAHSHSHFFSAVTHKQLNQFQLDQERQRFKTQVLPHLLAQAAKNRK
jgi:hypothetical protein